MEKKLIYTKMQEVMKSVGVVDKGQKNSSQGYKFRGIDDMLNAVHPALIKSSVFMTVDVLEKTEQLKEVTRSNGKSGIDKHVSLLVRYTFHAEDGSSVSSTVAGEGLDSGDKATNKAMSAALKYAFIQTFCVPTADLDDADSETPEIAPAAPKTEKAEPSDSGKVKTYTFRKAGQAPLAATGTTPASNNSSNDLDL